MAQRNKVAQAAARKRELTAQLAASRQTISRGKQELVKKLQIKNLLGGLVSRKPKALFAGSTVAGLIITMLLKRPRKSKKKPSPKNTQQILFTWLLSLLKPAAKAWLIARAKKLASERISRSQNNGRDSRVPQEQGNVLLDI